MILTRSNKKANKKKANKKKENKKKENKKKENKKKENKKKANKKKENVTFTVNINEKMENKKMENEKIDLDVIDKIIKEKICEKSNRVTFDVPNDYFHENVDLFDVLAEKQVEYDEMFLKHDLEIIADYYNIPKKRKRKSELIQDILLFEYDISNNDKVQKRKLMFFYLYELNNDKFFKKYLIFK